MSTPKYQPYAPSPYSYTPSPHALSTSISLDEEVKLSTSSQQRELNESLAEIYSIIVTLDFLEKAYIKDSINQEVYVPIKRPIGMLGGKESSVDGGMGMG